jgi:hypothetical protein
MARGLTERPATRSAFRDGALTEDQAAIVCRGGPVEDDEEVCDLAKRLAVPQLERLLARRPAPRPAAAAEPGEPGEVRREGEVGHDEEGTWGRIRLPHDEGALFQKGLTLARDHLFRLRHPDGAGSAAEVSWADGLLHLVQAGMDHLSTGSPSAMPAERTQVVYHLDVRDGRLVPHGADLPVPDSLRRLLTCDTVARLVVERDGNAVWLSARTRTVPQRLRTLVERRDGGCTVPGCGQRRWLQMHHIVHVEDGGPTSVDNLICLCPWHHRLHHRGRLGIQGNAVEGVVFRDQFGRVMERQPPPPPTGAPPRTTRPYTPPLGERARWLDLDWATQHWHWN